MIVEFQMCTYVHSGNCVYILYFVAFHFCIEYKRRTEFRKLCDIVRHHYVPKCFNLYAFL